MASASEIRQHVQDFLEDRASLQALADWSADYSWNIHQRTNDPEIRDLAYAVRGVLVEYSSGDVDELGLREELENAILPFVLPRVYTSPIEIEIGVPRYRATSTKPLEVHVAA